MAKFSVSFDYLRFHLNGNGFVEEKRGFLFCGLQLVCCFSSLVFGGFLILLHRVPFSSAFSSFVLIKKKSRFNFLVRVSLPSYKKLKSLSPFLIMLCKIMNAIYPFFF